MIAKKDEWKIIEPDKVNWLFSDNSKDAERGCIGHLRGDFGRGTEFWTTWHPHNGGENSQKFSDELDDVVNALREKGELLSNLSAMSSKCYQNDSAELSNAIMRSYGFQLETADYEYYLRCSPQRGDYNFYLYCCDKNAQREFAAKQAERQPSVLEQLSESKKAISPKASTPKKNEMEI